MKFKSLVQGPVVGVVVGGIAVGVTMGVAVGTIRVGTGCVGGTKTVDVAGGAQDVRKKITTENMENMEFSLLILRVLRDLRGKNL
jgi:mannose/fructose/N-acetylgalactosamine-specific phosphotransferase system component IIC